MRRTAVPLVAFIASALSWCAFQTQVARAADNTPPRCDTEQLSVTLVKEFQKAAIATPAPRASATPTPPCIMTLTNTYATPPPDFPANVKSDVSLTIDKTGLNVTFAMKQDEVVNYRGLSYDDNVFVTFTKPGERDFYFAAIVDAGLTCTSVSHMAKTAVAHDQCSVKKPHYWTRKQPSWGATLVISAANLDANVIAGETEVSVIRHVRHGKDSVDVYPFMDSTPIAFQRTAAQRPYASFGPHIGNRNIGGSNEIPPHRWFFNAYEPLFPSVYTAVTFADDAGKVLSIRDNAVKSIIGPDAAKPYKCHSCGSFRANNTEAFDSPITSTNVLGVDFSKVGLDTLPFTFDAVSYPIDTGYKLYGSADWGNIGAASLHGTTSKHGVAQDFVLNSLLGLSFNSGAKMYIGAYDVVANRSQAPIATPAFYPTTANTLLHSANALVSLGFTSPVSSDPLKNALVVNGLVRYGTQAFANSQTTDVAFSLLRSPPYINDFSVQPDRVSLTLAGGYRNVGPLYDPIDGSYDIHVGEIGYYGRGDILVGLNNGSIDFALGAYRFFDSLETRDEAVNSSVKYKMSPASSMALTYQHGSLAVLTAARANNIAVTDAQGGGVILPNSAHSTEFDTKPVPTLWLSVGYDWHEQQNCNQKITTAPPCFASTQSGPTYGVHWSPFAQGNFKDVFVEYSHTDAASNLFPATFDARSAIAQRAGLATTANRTVNAFALGTHVFTGYNNCSTLLLTGANRGGDVDNFAASPPQKGFTETASLDIAPGNPWPSVLVAWSRVLNAGSTTTPDQQLFLLRLQFGLPPRTYADAVSVNCNG